MKRLLMISLVLLSLAAGYFAGIQHALTGMELWAVECYNPAAPQESAWKGYDLRILVDLDGQTYEHGCTVY